jgi:hypothetical protein
VFKLVWYLKLKEGFSIMANKPFPGKIEWAFMLSYFGAIAFTLLAITFTPGLVGGIFGGLAIGSVYGAVRILLWIR